MKDSVHMEQIELRRLFLDPSKLDKNFFGYETDPSKIKELEHNDLINDSLMEHVRRFNSTADYLLHSLQRVSVYGQLLSDGKQNAIQDGKLIDIPQEHRIACRDTSINIDIYIEAIKSFCRYYFFMNKNDTDDGKKWKKALLQYKRIGGWNYIEAFLKQCETLLKSPDTIFLIQIRNDEVHNESPLQLINYTFTEDSLIPQPSGYVISNGSLHNTITKTGSLLVIVTQSLQNILEHIPPISIYKYLTPIDGQLKYITKMEERYKTERKYFLKHNVQHGEQ